MTHTRIWTVYLSGEIHTDWRERIADGIAKAGLPVELTGPITVHADSDDCGVAIFGAEPDKIWHDRKGAQLNAVRIDEKNLAIRRKRTLDEAGVCSNNTVENR